MDKIRKPRIKRAFEKGNLIDYFRLKELRQSAKKKGYWDLLPRINKFDTKDLLILESWKSLLTRKNCPWAVTEEDNTFILWKIDERVTVKELDEINKDANQRWFNEGTNKGYIGKEG